MRFATTTSVVLFFLSTAAKMALSAPLTNGTAAAIHEGVLAMMAGYFEGDIVLPGTESQRSGINDRPKKWPGGKIPYKVDDKLARDGNFTAVKNAMRILQSFTCLRFVQRTIQRNYLYLFPGEGCYSYVGLVGGLQPLSLGHGCLYMTTVAHELLHAVGFDHEHTRPDRDYYLKVMPKNVIPEFLDQFEKRSWEIEDFITSFDYDSVMLYGSDAFARDHSHPSMLSTEGKRLPDVYEKRELSISDIYRVREFYNC